jgi:hypothetical protein
MAEKDSPSQENIFPGFQRVMIVRKPIAMEKEITRYPANGQATNSFQQFLLLEYQDDLGAKTELFPVKHSQARNHRSIYGSCL